MKRFTLAAGLAILAVGLLAALLPLRAQAPNDGNGAATLAELKAGLADVKSDLAQIKKDLAEIKAMLSEMKGGKPTPPPPAKEAEAKELATKWLKAMFSGDIDSVMALVDVPFLSEGARVPQTKEQLKETLADLLGEMKDEKTDLSKVELEVLKSYEPDKDLAKLLKRVLPDGGIYVKATFEGEPIVIFIRPGEKLVVVGFSG